MGLKHKWLEYWSQQATPHHRLDSESYYARYGAELRMLMGTAPPRRVLDIGCGNGAMYSHLGFSGTDYTGVDFSERMLTDFRERRPGVRLVCGDGSTYRDDRKYDLVFSNGVLQYFDSRMLNDHVRLSKEMLAPGGRIVLASIPWKALRTEYYRGGALVDRPRRHSWLLAIVAERARVLRGLDLGKWYTFEQVQDVARKHQMSASFYGSLHYPYRFHAVLTSQDT